MKSEEVLGLSPDDRTNPIVPSDLSVVICVYTLDRWTDILAAVSSVLTQQAGVREVILVVDHNPDLMQRVSAEFPALTVIANSHHRGLSGARDTGVAHSSGRVVAFLDDDARAEPKWAVELSAAYGDPKVVGAGGWIEPDWSVRRPPWWPSEFDWVVGCSYRGLPEEPSPVRNFIGANMSFRRARLLAAGGFRTDLGRVGTRPLGCEETELCIRLTRARPDAVLLIDDRAVIHHRVPGPRERFRYFRTRTYAEGLSKALVARSVGADKGLESERRYTTRVLPAGVARGLRDALLTRPGGAGRAGAIVAGVLTAVGGYVVGSVRVRRGGATYAVAGIEGSPGAEGGTG